MAAKLEQSLREIATQYDLVAIYAFGSRAREIASRMPRSRADKSVAEHPDADVDIGVLCTPGHDLSARDRVKLMLALEDLFQAPRVDLVILREADPFLAANIVRGERLYAQDSYLADEYDLYVLRRAGDLAPLARERMALILGEGV